MGILELHLHEPKFNFAPSVGSGEPSRSGVGVDFGSEQESGKKGSSGPGAGAMVLGLVVLVGVALAARRLRSGTQGREETEYEQPPTT